MILNKRIKRELKENWFRYGALFFLIVLSISLVVSMASATDSIFYTIDINHDKNHVEDGEFTVFVPYSAKQIKEIDQFGTMLEENFYVDVDMEDGSALRIFKNREFINTVDLDKGTLANDSNEIVIEKLYAISHDLKLGDTIVIKEKEYTVSGIGSAPDYGSVKKNPFDVAADTDKFSIAFISRDAFEELLKKNVDVELCYSYRLNGDITDKKLKDFLVDMDFDESMIKNPYMKEIVDKVEGEKNMDMKYVNISYFIPNAENPRINDAEADSKINKLSALIAGVIILLLLAYMISVFIIHNIDKESAVIGALYSLGYLKKDLLKHFMILPIALVTVASMVGTTLGYCMIPYMESASTYYSFPELQTVIKPYIILYGLVVPMVIAVFINFFVINKKLSLSPLKLLRKEKRQNRIANIDLGNLSFINRYRIRQLLREIRGNITIVFGLFLAILLMVFGFGIKGTIDNYVKHTTDDAKYRNMYVLQYPENKIPAGGEEAYSESLYAHLDIIDTDLEVSILGIKEDNPYFDFKVKRDIDDVYISNSVAYKFGYKVGENIVLSDHIENRNYSFHVAGIVPYSNGLYIFADMDNMRKVFGKDKNYYNTILSDKKLNIEPGRIASVVTINDIAESASKFNDLMAELIIMLIAVSVIVFILVLYLLLKMMVDKSTFSISLIKVFGYNEKEVKKLYLGSAFYTVLVSSMIGIPISTLIVRAIWPYMISNVAAGFESYIPLSLYFTITGIILASYLVVNFLVGRHLKKVSLVEILKNRE
ncbi:ABC transporter permease [Clostridium sp. CS001]|uniref:ABC transporter permease n=1 Tax=Clostridium sp. CS001 TaxID=2880648 RepID=UPI001CF57D32|nr:ABC transporter permease [Clostridium sp. CS001]MCB2290166.1 ABC transporter permease [Clostridium sp. CS001]